MRIVQAEHLLKDSYERGRIMALLPFKTDKPQGGLAGKVLALRQKGLDDHAIIERLQKEGHTATEIFDALREADAQQQPTWPEETSSSNMPNMPSANPSLPAESSPQMGIPPLPPSNTSSSMQQSAYSTPQAPPLSTPPPPPAQQAQVPPAHQESVNTDALREQLDALAETIIEEKWKELRLLLDKIVEWKQKVEGRILSLEREVNLLKEEVLTIQKSVLQRVEEYDQHIGDVMSEMKAMEKVFQKIIPNLTDNVSELRNIVEDLKTEKTKKTRKS